MPCRAVQWSCKRGDGHVRERGEEGTELEKLETRFESLSGQRVQYVVTTWLDRPEGVGDEAVVRRGKVWWE